MFIPGVIGPRLSPHARAAFKGAVGHAKGRGSQRIETVDLLCALVTQQAPVAATLAAHGVGPAELDDAVAASQRRTSQSAGLTDADRDALAAFGIDADAILAGLGDPQSAAMPTPRTSEPGQRGMSPDLRRAVVDAYTDAHERDSRQVTDTDLLLACYDADPDLRRLLGDLGVTRDDLAGSDPRS